MKGFPRMNENGGTQDVATIWVYFELPRNAVKGELSTVVTNYS